MGFAENIRAVRKQKGISQEELAELSGVSRQAVSKWEQGTGFPEVEKILILSKKLDISLDALMSERPIDLTEVQQNRNMPNGAGSILISSFDGKSLVNCYKVLSSNRFRTRQGEPKYALFGIDGNSFWGEHSTVLGWYEHEDNIKKEIKGIQSAIKNGDASYDLKYAVNVKRHWGNIKIDE